jgi:general secretion pathway protein C
MLGFRPSSLAAFRIPLRVLLPASSLLVWGLVAFSAVAWGLRWSVPAASPVNAMVAVQSEVDMTAAARSLGAMPAQVPVAPSLASRFQLQGVLAGGGSQGVALIAVDGKAAKPYRVGAFVTEGVVLQSARGRRISLGAGLDGPEMVVLELPAKK